jgi:transposase
MRNSFAGLVGLVKSTLVEDPLCGTLYLFTNRRRTLVKGVFWDRTGFCLFAKRLERGHFVLPGDGDTLELNEQTFQLLLDGIVLALRR